jgi:autotransporter translocation and assembly factor TamB
MLAGRLRWWQIALVALVVVAIAVPVASWALLRVYGPQLTRERIETALTDALGQPVRVGAVDLKPWLLRLSVLDIGTEGAPGSEVQLLGRLPRADVSVAVESLWRRELVLSVALIAPDIRVDTSLGGAGETSIFPLPASFQLGPLHVRIAAVRIARGHLAFRDRATGFGLDVVDGGISARPVAGDLDVSLDVGRLGFDLADVRDHLEHIVGEGRLSADRIRVGRLAWQWEGRSMQIEGAIREPWRDAKQLALHIAGELPLAPLARRAGIQTDVRGTARIAADVTGAQSSPRVAGDISIPELIVAGTSMREVAIKGDWVDRMVHLDPIRLRVGEGRVSGRLTTGAIDAAGTSVKLDIRELALPEPLFALGLGAGTLEGRVSRSGLDPVRAEAKWNGAVLALDGRVQSDGPLALRGRLTTDLGTLRQTAQLGSLAGQATVTADISGEMAAPTLTGRLAVTGLVAGNHPLEPVDASFRFAGRASKQATALTRWEGDLQCPLIASGSMRVENLTAALAIDPQQAALRRATARVAAIPITASGVWSWSGSGRAHADLGPAALGEVRAVPSNLGLAGIARGGVDVTVDRGMAESTAGIDLTRVAVAGFSLGDGRIEIRSRGADATADLALPSRKLSVKARGTLEPGTPITAHAELGDLPLRPLLAELSAGVSDRIDGRVSGRGDVSIPLDRPAAGTGLARIELADLRVLGERWTSRGPAIVRWRDGRFELEPLRVDGPLGALTASGALTDTAQLSLALESARLPGPLAALGRGLAHAELRATAGAVELARFDAEWPGLSATATGRRNADGRIALDARAQAELAKLAAIAGAPAVAGRATVTTELRGHLDALEATGHMRVPRLDVAGVTASDVDVPFRLSGSTLSVERAQAVLGASRIAVDGRAAWAGTGALSTEALARDVRVAVDLRMPALRLEDLDPLLPSGARGHGEVAIRVHADGSFNSWRGTAAVDAPRLDLDAGPVRDAHAVLALDERSLTVTDLKANALGVPVQGTGNWLWAGGASARATLGPAPLSALPAVLPSLTVAGTVRASLEATMPSTADLAGTARAVFADVAVAGVDLGRGQLDLSVSQRAFRAQLGFAERRLGVTASGPLTREGKASAEATISSLDLGPLLRRAGAGALGGTLSARATWRGPLAEPRRGEGAVTIDPLALVTEGQSWESRGPLEMRWTDGGLRIVKFELGAREATARATGGLRPDGTLDIAVDGRLPLGLLAALRPEIRSASGIAELSLRATGPVAAPTLLGEGTIREGNLLFRDRPETVRDLTARFSLSERSIALREASAGVGGGRVEGRGEIALDHWQLHGYRFRAVAKGVGLATIEGLSTAWDAELELSGLGQQAVLQGDVRLARGVYSRDLSLLSMALSSHRALAAEEGSPLRLRLRVKLDDNLVVRNRTIDLRAGGTLTVEGTAGQPAIFGAIESHDGRIAFRGHDFTVVTATVRFVDPQRIDPVLDVVATSHIREYDVTLQANGRTSDLKVRLSSSPTLPQDDLLALVAFGVTRAELKDSPGSVLVTEAAKAIAQNVLGIDPTVPGLRVGTVSSTDSTTEIKHGPFEEHAPPASSRNSPGDRRERVQIEYQLLKPLFLRSDYDLEGGYGADVVLRFRFR